LFMVEYINDLGVFQMSWVGALSIARGMETAPTSNRNETHPITEMKRTQMIWVCFIYFGEQPKPARCNSAPSVES